MSYDCSCGETHKTIDEWMEHAYGNPKDMRIELLHQLGNNPLPDRIIRISETMTGRKTRTAYMPVSVIDMIVERLSKIDPRAVKIVQEEARRVGK